MAKEWRFYDSAGNLRKVKEAYFYDDAGNRRKIKEGYFYDAQGNRRQFADLGLPAPPNYQFKDYPGADFTFQAAEPVAGYFGWQLGLPSNPANPVIPVSNYPAEECIFAWRVNAVSGRFDLTYDKDQTSDPIFGFYSMILVDANDNPMQTLRRSASSTSGAGTTGSWTWSWPYILPLTIGSVYKLLFKTLARSDTMVTGTIPGKGIGYDYSLGIGTIGQLNVRGNTAIYRIWTGNGSLVLQLRQTGNPPIGKAFIGGINFSTVGNIGWKPVEESTYTTFMEGGDTLHQWEWEEDSLFSSGASYPFEIS